MPRWSGCARAQLVIPITGRPAGWSTISAHVAGGRGGGRERRFYSIRRRAQKLAQRVCTTRKRRRNREEISLRERILREVPGCALASDQLYREADAHDYFEDVPRLADASGPGRRADARGRHDAN